MSPFEITCGYVLAAASKAVMVGLIILLTSSLFIDIKIAHPIWMVILLLLISSTFSLFGFIIGIWANDFEKLQIIPLLIITPLTFLGGSFYSIKMLPIFWQNVSLFNPMVYLISAFRWSFYENSDINIFLSMMAILTFLLICIFLVYIIFKTGYKIKT